MNNNLTHRNLGNKKSLDKAKNLINIANGLTIKTLMSNTTELPMNSNTTYIGIDFGTSTTVVSIATNKEGLEELESNSIVLNQKLYDGSIYKSYKIPTMIGWYKNKILFGEGANQLKLELKQGKNLWHSFKMELGEDIGAKYPESELNNDKYTILNPKDAATLFFKYLKTQIEKYIQKNDLPQDIQYSVSIPASFEANQRKDLIDSLHANNMMINKQALIDEPNAAFLSYISNQDLKNSVYISEDYPTNILVFDFGAGTCDISILEIANSTKGYRSKNLAISRFEALGGNNIDKAIARNLLLKQFLNENNIEEHEFRKKEINIILSRLEKSAELLKIKISEQLDLIKNNADFVNIVNSNQIIQVNNRVQIRSKKGTFTLETPKITYKEFTKIIDDFTTINIQEHENDKDLKNIFTPITSALEKAHLSSQDIDYILFIGGSVKNPLIQKSLKDYFEDSEYLIPSDLQAHVSSGAAIHSLMHNGYGKNLIDPITSEPILAMVKDGGGKETLTTLLKAGTTIPCNDITIDNLQIQRKNQAIIEIPLYIGNNDKLLHNIKIESPSSSGFLIDTNIKLILSVNADKMLIVKVTINNDKTIEIEPLNPFSNEVSTFKDREKFQVEKEYNEAIANNHGKKKKESLLKLYEGYDSLGLELDAAEILEELHEKYNYSSLNNIGLHYSNAGDEKKAMLFYEKDFKQMGSAVTAFNIALKYKYEDSIKYKEWLLKSLDINPNYNGSLYLYGVYLVNHDDETKGIDMINRAFNSWQLEYDNHNLSSHVSWFISCAKYLEKYDLVDKLEKENKESEDSLDDFNLDNILLKKEQ